MTSATIAQVKSRFDRFIKASENGPIVVTRKGKPVAMLLGGENDDEMERLMMAYSPKLRAILDRAEAQIQAGQGIPAERFWAELDAMSKPPKRRAKSPVRASRRRRAG